MKTHTPPTSLFVGWDVGGWNCEKNSKSRDAIVLIDPDLNIVGKPWRGNLRQTIVDARTSGDWLVALFAACGLGCFRRNVSITMAIDTPLGFPVDFVELITGKQRTEVDGPSALNRYLFRRTERKLFEQGLKPLSAVKDMIGSQATKGMHVVSKFAPLVESCGVWTDGRGFRAIETYPTAWRNTPAMKALLKGAQPLIHADVDDARVCALVAHLFATSTSTLEAPDATVPASEGWIWVPRFDA